MSARWLREALFGQAGIIATRDVGELIEAGALLASQPMPADPYLRRLR
jgi:acyl-CoA synthetase (NDP forming)